MILALKLTWIRKYKNSGHKWKNIITDDFKQFNQLESYGPEIVNRYAGGNAFWTEVFNAYKTYYYKVEIKRVDEFLAINVCYNRNILLDKITINRNNWIRQGVRYIADFIGEDGTFYNRNEFNRKYSLMVDYITYNGTLMSIKKYLKTFKFTIRNNKRISQSLQIQTLYKVVRGSKEYYNILLKSYSLPKCTTTWQTKLSYEVNWKLCFKKTNIYTDINMKWFKIRILHRIIATNVVLKRMGLKASDVCNFCEKERDGIIHIFWRCKIIQRFWETLATWINDKCENVTSLKFSERYILFGVEPTLKTDIILDFIVESAKQYIYSCKYENTRPVLNVFKKKIVRRHKIDRYNAVINQKLQDFNNQWLFYECLLI